MAMMLRAKQRLIETWESGLIYGTMAGGLGLVAGILWTSWVMR